LGLFGGKKPDRDAIIAEGLAQAEADAASAGQEKKEDGFSSGNPKLDIEMTKIKAQLESFNEVRKANSERFSRLSEQLGELRGMIMDTNKTMSKIEVSATKAIDLVESIQPEKLMIEIRKQEGKGEALKANIESNEAIMRDIMEELKKMRQQMNFYKGIEQVAKLNEEVKGEILEVKKVEATIERHADKAESIFLDLEKKLSEFDKFQRTIDEIDKNFHAIQGDFDNMKVQLSNKADKKEFLNLMDKFTEFEKHTGNVMKLLDERSKHMKIELKATVGNIKELLRKKQGIVTDEKTLTDDKGGNLPEPETGGISLMDGIVKKPGIIQNQPTKEKAVEWDEEVPESEGKEEVKKEESKEGQAEKNGKNVKTGLLDVLKKRKIVTHALSDESENNEDSQTEGK